MKVDFNKSHSIPSTQHAVPRRKPVDYSALGTPSAKVAPSVVAESQQTKNLSTPTSKLPTYSSKLPKPSITTSKVSSPSKDICVSKPAVKAIAPKDVTSLREIFNSKLPNPTSLSKDATTASQLKSKDNADAKPPSPASPSKHTGFKHPITSSPEDMTSKDGITAAVATTTSNSFPSPIDKTITRTFSTKERPVSMVELPAGVRRNKYSTFPRLQTPVDSDLECLTRVVEANAFSRGLKRMSMIELRSSGLATTENVDTRPASPARNSRATVTASRKASTKEHQHCFRKTQALERDVQEWAEKYAKLEAETRHNIEDLKRIHAEKCDEMLQVAGEVVRVNETLRAKLDGKAAEINETEYLEFLKAAHKDIHERQISSTEKDIERLLASISQTTIAIQKSMNDLKLNCLTSLLEKIETIEAKGMTPPPQYAEVMESGDALFLPERYTDAVGTRWSVALQA